MQLVARYFKDCPAWYDLPVEGEPTLVYGWGGSEPPADLTPDDLRIVLHHSHDYRIVKGRYRHMYSGGTNMWVIFQYGMPEFEECSRCQGEVQEHRKFCPFCGQKRDPKCLLSIRT